MFEEISASRCKAASIPPVVGIAVHHQNYVKYSPQLQLNFADGQGWEGLDDTLRLKGWSRGHHFRVLKIDAMFLDVSNVLLQIVDDIHHQ